MDDNKIPSQQSDTEPVVANSIENKVRPIFSRRFGFAGLCFLAGFLIFAAQMFYSTIGSPPSWIGAIAWLSATAFLVIIGIWFWDRSAGSHWIVRSFCTVVVLGLAFGLGYRPIRKQYSVEHPDQTIPPSRNIEQPPKTNLPEKKEPPKKGKIVPTKPVEKGEAPAFAVAVEWAMLSYGGGEFGTPFWVSYRSPSGCSISSVQMVLFIRIKNLRSVPVTVIGYGVDAGFPLVRLPTGSVFSLMPPGKSLLGAKIGDVINFGQGPGFSMVNFPNNENDFSHAQLLEMESIDVLLNKPLEPNVPVRGWSFFEYPSEKAYSAGGPVRIHIKTDDTLTSSYEVDLKNPDPQWDVLKRPMKVISVVDLSNCKRRPYY